MIQLKRYEKNPILTPTNNPWECKATFNPGCILIKDKIYILYRAMSNDNVSYVGLAVSSNGFEIEERLEQPIYVPREYFERRDSPTATMNTGCEDVRITLIDDKLYMLYTAVTEKFDYVRVAMSYIKVKDFLERKWDKWSKPVLISPPGVWDKDACLLPRKIKGRWVLFHRFVPNIWIDFVKDLEFKNYWIYGEEYIKIRENLWDSDRIGIGGVPIETTEGWVAIYHGRSKYDGCYRLGAMLLDKTNPTTVLARLPYPILEPKEWYEKEGEVNNVVFSNGHVLIDDTLIVYYGGADKYTGVAYIDFNELVGELLKYEI